MTTLPHYGPLPRPDSLDAARETLRREAFPVPTPALTSVTFATEEFTALCPRTGQPDFMALEISYVPAPAGRCLESKALKFYLWAFRDEGAYCETLAGRIATDVLWATDASSVTVRVLQRPRGGLALTAVAHLPLPSSEG